MPGVVWALEVVQSAAHTLLELMGAARIFVVPACTWLEFHLAGFKVGNPFDEKARILLVLCRIHGSSHK